MSAGYLRKHIVPGNAFTSVLELARSHFNDEVREAAGWLIARGVGMDLPLPGPAPDESAPSERWKPKIKALLLPDD